MTLLKHTQAVRIMLSCFLTQQNWVQGDESMAFIFEVPSLLAQAMHAITNVTIIFGKTIENTRKAKVEEALSLSRHRCAFILGKEIPFHTPHLPFLQLAHLAFTVQPLSHLPMISPRYAGTWGEWNQASGSVKLLSDMCRVLFKDSWRN